MTSIGERLAASDCNTADVCLMAANCPFAADCRAVEEEEAETP